MNEEVLNKKVVNGQENLEKEVLTFESECEIPSNSYQH